ncbi:hypothetical protein KG089_00125 [Carnobacteriaceae bacterium zg-ZUI252]|nr:hypothetical protein [Carnobacteriaceae bacterium zg-ZUI252]MBS4770553.1 hypothetical protein [Carnobacteriaceae bacterium zg-ZUI240]
MLDFEKKQFEEWQNAHEFEKIVHYVDLLKEPSYEHLGQKAAALNNLRRYYEAKELLESIFEQGQNDAMWYYRYGYLQMQFEEFSRAETMLKKAVELDRQNGNAWYLLSVLYEYFLHEHDLAQMAHQKAIEHQVNIDYLDDDTFKVNQQFNKQYRFIHQLMIEDEALKKNVLEAFFQMIYLFEQHVNDYAQLPTVLQAFSHTIKQLFANHNRRLNEPVRQALEDDILYILDWFGVNYQLAETLCALFRFESFKQQPFHIKAEHLMYLLDTTDQQFERKVVTLFEQLSEEEKTIDYYLLAIEIYLDEDNVEMGRQLLQESHDLGQENDFWWQMYGYLLMLEGNHLQALDAFEKSVALNEENAESWMGIEQLYIDFFDDLSRANFAREKWERLIDEEDGF